MECDPGFLPLLARFHEVALESHHGVIFGIWADGRLAYTNPAWQQFALDNDGAHLMQSYTIGRSVFPAMNSQLAEFYKGAIQSCLDSQEPWRYEYECSSPEVFRRHQTVAYPLKREGLLFVNSLLIEHPINEKTSKYISDDGLVMQCWRCCRFAQPGELHQWDTIRNWVSTRLRVSHGLCLICLCYHFPEMSQPIVDDVLRDHA
jgi:hypothetical protein